MICPINMQGYYGEQWGLVTAIALGFLFGFSLERSGFGNARKLAAQFYGYDMTVFKVMFTAVLVAMVGLYACAAFGFVNMTQLWINPTYMWAQLIGGFLLGIGFAVSGLCPGTAVVATASGRIDGLVTVGGAFAGTAIFSLLIGRFSAVEALYGAGFQGRSLLHELVGIEAPWLALAVAVMALGAFIGAEALEKRFAPRFAPVPLTPTGGGRVKYFLIGALVIVAGASGLAPAPESPAAVARFATPIEPLELAEAIIAGGPGLTLMDLRDEAARADGTVPGARAGSLAASDSISLRQVSFSMVGGIVLLVDGAGAIPELPALWPAGREYRYLRGGYAAWKAEVLTPLDAAGGSGDELALTARQNQIAAYFSGTAANPVSSAPPPPLPSGGSKGKKKGAGGC